jgi:predicted RNA binding protein YcfA (HicA-like mRNA interferase family)
MGRLSGHSCADVIRKLRRAGFVFDRMAKGSHEIWLHPKTFTRVTIPNHPGDMPEGTVNAIVKSSGLSVTELLDL